MKPVTQVAGARNAWVVGVVGALVVSLIGLAAPPASADPVAPTATPDSVTLVTGTTVLVSPLANDVAPGGDAASLTLTSFAAPDPAAAVVTQVGNDLSVASTAGFVGSLVFDYVVSHVSGGTATSTITVTVTAPPNAPPVAVPDTGSMYSPAELRLDPRANDSDPDGDALTVTDAVTTTPAAGSVTLEGGILVIRSTAGFAGPMTVLYTVTDARGAQAQGTVTISVLGPPPNNAPLAVGDAAAVRSGRTVKVKVLANDTDPDGDQIRLVKVGKAKRGKARKSGQSVVYRAPSSYRGTVTITYTIADARGATAQGTLTISVTRKAPAKPKPRPTPTPTPAPDTSGTSKASVESALARLRLPVGAADGRYDARTRRAVCAWRTITGRSAHRGLPTAAEAAAIVATDGLPRANGRMVTGVTVSVTCQAAFWVGGDRGYRRVMAATTGKPGYRTRVGTHHVFRTHHVWRYSTIYPEARMYKPMQFSGGQALHGSATDALVKTYPASHGCVRMLHRDIDALQAGGVGNGTTVRVIGRW